MPHNNPSTNPNIFDIFISSITDILRCDQPKTKASPPPKTNQSYKPPAPAPVQVPKPKSQKNDDFNFFEWLFNPVNPPNPSTHRTTHHISSKPQPIHRNTNQHEIIGNQSNLDKNSKNIQELLACLKTKSYKKYGTKLEKLEQILNLSLSCTDSENIASQSNIKEEEIIKFLELLTEITQENPNKFDSVIRKSFQGLQHLQSYQNSDDKITTTPKSPDEILLDAFKKIALSFHPDDINLKIYQGLLNPEIEDNFFIKYFCISKVGDSYPGPGVKPMILQRAEKMLNHYTESLKTIIQQQAISKDDLERINSYIDGQNFRGIKVLNRRLHNYEQRQCSFSSTEMPQNSLINHSIYEQPPARILHYSSTQTVNSICFQLLNSDERQLLKNYIDQFLEKHLSNTSNTTEYLSEKEKKILNGISLSLNNENASSITISKDHNTITSFEKLKLFSQQNNNIEQQKIAIEILAVLKNSKNTTQTIWS